MIPNNQDRVLEERGVTDSRSFGISMENSAHIMGILRDQLYTDKILAILREYGANAWDAHRESGKQAVPIKVTIPTVSEPNLCIRDFGFGLSPTGMFEVYTQYGASTKRASNVAVGMLGIGSKSGFSYSDSFTITSWHCGTKRIYAAVLDESDKGRINLLHEEPCGEETGVEIQIPVKHTDIPEFIKKAQNLYRHFTPRPEINVDLPPLNDKRVSLKYGTIIPHVGSYYGNNEWVAIMGCVPYRIDMKQVADKIGDFVHRISGELHFDIGEVSVSASREELKYTETTKKAIIKKLEQLVDEFVATTLECLKDPTMTGWQKRLRSVILAHLNMPVPKDLKDFVQTYLRIDESTDKVILKTQITIVDSCRIIIKDDLRKFSGFGTQGNDQFAELMPGFTVADVTADLDAILKKHHIDGITVKKLSELPWSPPYKKERSKRILTDVHKAKRLVLAQDRSFYVPLSKCWEVEDSVPSDDDVFVIVSGFRSVGGFDVFRAYDVDKTIAELAGMKMPKIYGYKTRSNKPVEIDDCDGTYYPEWRKEFIQKAVKKLSSELNDYLWSEAVGDYREFKVVNERLESVLGHDHEFVKFWKMVQKARERHAKLKYDSKRPLKRLIEVSEIEKSDIAPPNVLKKLFEKYPLLQLKSTGLDAICGAEAQHWAEYVQLMDLLWAEAKENT